MSIFTECVRYPSPGEVVEKGHIFSTSVDCHPFQWSVRIIWKSDNDDNCLVEVLSHPPIPSGNELIFGVPVDHVSRYLAVINPEQLQYFEQKIQSCHCGPNNLILIFIRETSITSEDYKHALFIGSNYHFSYIDYMKRNIHIISDWLRGT